MTYIVIVVLAVLGIWVWTRRANRTEPGVSDHAEKELVEVEKALARFYLAKSPHPVPWRYALRLLHRCGPEHCGPRTRHCRRRSRIGPGKFAAACGVGKTVCLTRR